MSNHEGRNFRGVATALGVVLMMVAGAAILSYTTTMTNNNETTLKKVPSFRALNGVAASSIDLVGTSSKGHTIYLSVTQSGVSYDIISKVYNTNITTTPFRILTRYYSNSGGAYHVNVYVGATTYEPLAGFVWEAVTTTDLSAATFTLSSSALTVSIPGSADAVYGFGSGTNAPTNFGNFQVSSFNQGHFSSRPTAAIATPSNSNLFFNHGAGLVSSQATTHGRALVGSVSVSSALKDCLSEAAWLSYWTTGSDYTAYINTPSQTGSGSYGTYPTSTSSTGAGSLAASSTQTCGSVLSSGQTVVAFQGTSIGGDSFSTIVSNLFECWAWDLGGSWSYWVGGNEAACANDIQYDLDGITDNFAAGYSGSKAWSNSASPKNAFTYCVGHSLGGARALQAAMNGWCQNVVTFASPLVSYTGSTPVTQFQRTGDFNDGDGCCDIYCDWDTYLDIVPQVGYSSGSSYNVQYTKIGSPDSIGNPTCIASWATQAAGYGLTSTENLHVMGTTFPFSVSNDGY